MSKFWQKKYISEYTGAEIDAAVAKAGELTKVTANPTLAGTEAALTGLEVGDTKYKVEQPINVVANPTLAGTEAALTGLQVGNTKYKVEAGGVPIIRVEASSADLTSLMGGTGVNITCDILVSDFLAVFNAGGILQLYGTVSMGIDIPMTLNFVLDYYINSAQPGFTGHCFKDNQTQLGASISTDGEDLTKLVSISIGVTVYEVAT